MVLALRENAFHYDLPEYLSYVGWTRANAEWRMTPFADSFHSKTTGNLLVRVKTTGNLIIRFKTRTTPYETASSLSDLLFHSFEHSDEYYLHNQPCFYQGFYHEGKAAKEIAEAVHAMMEKNVEETMGLCVYEDLFTVSGKRQLTEVSGKVYDYFYF